MATTAASASAAVSSSRTAKKIVLEKITARVFCRADVDVTRSAAAVEEEAKNDGATTSSRNGGSGGGNPLTIFSYNNDNNKLRNNMIQLHPNTRRQLARTCDWESVVVDQRTKRGAASFHLPKNGNPVAFCAHAAMGAAVQLADKNENGRNGRRPNQTTSLPFDFETIDHDKLTATVYDANNNNNNNIHVVALNVHNTPAKIELVDHPPTLYRILRDAFGLQSCDLTKRSDAARYPTFVNSFVFDRPKTLVSVNSIDTLHRIKPPSNPGAFRDACDALSTTGIYLHAKEEEEHNDLRDDHYSSSSSSSSSGVWECRQFPRDSGYPEDPATGVAAASLAIALHPFWKCTEYQFLQGTAMQRPSLIVVQDLNLHQQQQQQLDDDVNNNGDSNNITIDASFQLLGRVEIDKKETIEVDIEDYDDDTCEQH